MMQPQPQPHVAPTPGKKTPLTELERRLITSFLHEQFLKQIEGEQGKTLISGMVEAFSQKVAEHGEPPIHAPLRWTINLEVAWGEILQALRPAHTAAILQGK